MFWPVCQNVKIDYVYIYIVSNCILLIRRLFVVTLKGRMSYWLLLREDTTIRLLATLDTNHTFSYTFLNYTHLLAIKPSTKHLYIESSNQKCQYKRYFEARLVQHQPLYVNSFRSDIDELSPWNTNNALVFQKLGQKIA